MELVEFWYEFGSTYSYPAAMRIERLAAAADVSLRWRPFLLVPIFKAYGWNDSPFNIYAAKGSYMWRDLTRICEAEGLPLKLPPLHFPQNSLKAAGLALVGECEGWMPAFTRAVFAANYAEQRDISDDATLAVILVGLGVDSRRRQCAGQQRGLEAPDRGGGFARAVRRAVLYHRRRIVSGNDRLEAGLAWAKRA